MKQLVSDLAIDWPCDGCDQSIILVEGAIGDLLHHR